jgi:hypothetical protein
MEPSNSLWRLIVCLNYASLSRPFFGAVNKIRRLG